MCIKPPDVPNVASVPNVKAHYAPERLATTVASVRAKLTARHRKAGTHEGRTQPSLAGVLTQIAGLLPRASALLAPEEGGNGPSAVLSTGGADNVPVWEEANDLAAALDYLRVTLGEELDELIKHLLNLAMLGDSWVDTDPAVGLYPIWITAHADVAQSESASAYDRHFAVPCRLSLTAVGAYL